MAPGGDPYADFRDTPVQSLVCVPPMRLVEHQPPLPTADLVVTACVFIIAAAAVSIALSVFVDRVLIPLMPRGTPDP
jgi:hypothetical protein